MGVRDDQDLSGSKVSYQLKSTHYGVHYTVIEGSKVSKLNTHNMTTEYTKNGK